MTRKPIEPLRLFRMSARDDGVWSFEFRAPATWWQHVKLALRTRWPRLFRRLIVRWVVAERDWTFRAADPAQLIEGFETGIAAGSAVREERARLRLVKGDED